MSQTVSRISTYAGQTQALPSTDCVRHGEQERGSIGATSQINATEIGEMINRYLNDCELRLLSPRTIETRRVFLRNLRWFLNDKECAVCDETELRHFFHYLMHGHEEPGGRFGNPQLRKPARPVTIKDYYVCFRSFFDWLAAIREISESPFNHIPKPRVNEEDKAPLNSAQIENLLQAARSSVEPERNAAILTFLLDTGCRASELISIAVKDLDFANRSCPVLGKGNKRRTLYFGTHTALALQSYLSASESQRQSASGTTHPLFLSAGSGQALTRSGLLQLMERLAERAGIKGQVSPHALRRTFAVQTLKNGANVFSVQAMLGHSNLRMTQKYCRLAQTDVETQHRQFSPVDRMAVSSLA